MRATVLLVTGAAQVMGAGLLLLWSYKGAPNAGHLDFLYTARSCAFFSGVALMNGLTFVSRALAAMKERRAAHEALGA